nr:DUF945 family protein [uncultured Duganella sp.]
MASAVLAIPTFATAAKPKPPEVPSELSHTVTRAAQELKVLQGESNFVRQLDNYAKFEFSPELRPKLKAIFGSERPFPLERVPGSAKGQIDYVGKLAAHSYKQPNGTEFSWTDAVLNITTDKAGRAVSGNGSWPSLLVTGPGSAFSMVNMRLNSKQQRGADGVTYGDVNLKIGVITARALQAEGGSKEVMRLNGVEFRSDVMRRGTAAEIAIRTTVEAITVGNEQVDHANFAFRFTKIPAKALAELDKSIRVQENSKLSQAEQSKQQLKVMTDFGKRALVAGATLVIDDLSASYHGNTASVKGSIGFSRLVESDFKGFAEWMKKMVARFEVRVPVALVKDASRAFAAKSIDASAPDAAQQIDKAADGMVSVVVGKVVTSGYAVIEKDELRAIIDIKNGKLIVNGKEIDVAGQMKAFSDKLLPKTKPAIAPDVQPEPAAE